MTRFRPNAAAAATALSAALLAAGATTAGAQQPPAPVAAPPAAPATAPAPVVSAEARALVEQMIAAHKALASFSATSEFVTPTDPTVKATRTVRSQIAVDRPNRVRITSTLPEKNTTLQVVSDGTSLFVASSAEKTYRKTPAGTGAEVITNAFRAAQGTSLGLLAVLFSPKTDLKAVLPGETTTLFRAPDETLDGTPVDVVSAVVNAGGGGQQLTMTFATGKNDHLVRRITLSGKTSDIPAGGKTGVTTFLVTETYTNVQANPDLPTTTFVFTPAAGATLAQTPKEPATYDTRLKVGAAPLPFSGTDLSGKPVTLAQYKGKVVLLDFWATWCGPCVAELPNVVSAYSKYKSNGFDIVGVSLDRAGDREKLVAFTKSHAMPWRQIYDGKYWQAAQAQRYGVQAIPFTLLIGRDGKIAAVGARGEELEPAIQAALAKK